MPVSPPHALLQPEVWGAGVIPIAAPLCVCMHVRMRASSPPLASVFYLSPTGPSLMSLAWCCPLVKDVTQRQARGCFPCSHCFQKRRRGGLSHGGSWWQCGSPASPRAGLCMTPKLGEEGCCHGGLCEANSSRVKWEIFIPRVRQRAGQRPRAGEPGYYGHSKAVVCGQVALGRFLAVSSLAVSVSPPGWGEASALPCQGRCGEPGAYSEGGPGLREILVGCVCLTPSLLLGDPLCVGCFGDAVS